MLTKESGSAKLGDLGSNSFGHWVPEPGINVGQPQVSFITKKPVTEVAPEGIGFCAEDFLKKNELQI